LLCPPDDVVSDVDVDEALLRRLLSAQHPDLAGEPVRRFAEGWDNVLFRIGTRFIGRMPRRVVAAPLVLQEARWLPRLAPWLPLAIPSPERQGAPGEGYPFPWAIYRWLDGAPVAGAALPADRTARDLAGFLAALHGLDPPRDGPESDARGVSPGARSEFLLERLRRDRVRGQVDAIALEAAWLGLIEAPDWAGRAVWCHGDLNPFNTLAHRGRLSAVLDWGDMHVREPAPDLAAAWMMLPTAAHARFRGAYGEIDPSTWRRARAWALYFGVMFVDAGAGGAGEAATRIGRTTLARVLT